MIHARSTVIALVLTATSASALLAQQNVDYVTEGGVRYQVITSTTERPISSLRYEPREITVNRERFTTDLQDSVRTYQVPVTQYEWVPGYQKTWNVFAPPVLSYRLLPVTRWKTQTETIKVPITRRDVVPERQVQQVPVTDTKVARETVVRRVAIGMAGDAPSVARNEQIGGSGASGSPEEAPPADAFPLHDRGK